jgi:hypothetical protein
MTQSALLLQLYHQNRLKPAPVLAQKNFTYDDKLLKS